VLTTDHTVLPATHTFIHIWNEPSCLYSQPQSIAVIWPVLISRAAESRRLSWPAAVPVITSERVFNCLVSITDDVQLPPHCAACNDQSAPGVDDDVTAGRKSTAKYACVDCGGDRMCAECACAHREQRSSRGHRLVELDGEATSSWTHCVNHPRQPISAYCADCGNAVCGQCGSVGGPPRLLGLDTSICRCVHSALADLSTAARTGRSQLQHDQQVDWASGLQPS